MSRTKNFRFSVIKHFFFWVLTAESRKEGFLNDIAEEVSCIVKISMESALKRLVPEVPFVVEPEIRETWGKIK